MIFVTHIRLFPAGCNPRCSCSAGVQHPRSVGGFILVDGTCCWTKGMDQHQLCTCYILHILMETTDLVLEFCSMCCGRDPAGSYQGQKEDGLQLETGDGAYPCSCAGVK